MSPARRRDRRPPNVPRPELARPKAAARATTRTASAPKSATSKSSPWRGRSAGAIGPPPIWNWRTFPVFFAFAAALFIGVYLGLVVAETADSGNNIPTLVVFLGTAILFGAALSRLTTGFILRRKWARTVESRGTDGPA